jgi:hypothetical protein
MMDARGHSGTSIRLPSLKQERNLDTRFQVRIGYLLREYASNPYSRRKAKLPTIARLVLLTYICSGLAVDEKDRLLVWGSDPPRELTISGTYGNLCDAGLK